jgi:hypothetical protein
MVMTMWIEAISVILMIMGGLVGIIPLCLLILVLCHKIENIDEDKTIMFLNKHVIIGEILFISGLILQHFSK